MPGLPTIIPVGPINYTVVLVPSLTTEEGKVAFGLQKPMQQELRINSTALEDAQRVTLFHEYLHAIDNLYDLELTEPQVTLLANIIMDTLTRMGRAPL